MRGRIGRFGSVGAVGNCRRVRDIGDIGDIRDFSDVRDLGGIGHLARTGEQRPDLHRSLPNTLHRLAVIDRFLNRRPDALSDFPPILGVVGRIHHLLARLLQRLIGRRYIVGLGQRLPRYPDHWNMLAHGIQRLGRIHRVRDRADHPSHHAHDRLVGAADEVDILIDGCLHALSHLLQDRDPLRLIGHSLRAALGLILQPVDALIGVALALLDKGVVVFHVLVFRFGLILEGAARCLGALPGRARGIFGRRFGSLGVVHHRRYRRRNALDAGVYDGIHAAAHIRHRSGDGFHRVVHSRLHFFGGRRRHRARRIGRGARSRLHIVHRAGRDARSRVGCGTDRRLHVVHRAGCGARRRIGRRRDARYDGADIDTQSAANPGILVRCHTKLLFVFLVGLPRAYAVMVCDICVRLAANTCRRLHCTPNGLWSMWAISGSALT